MLCQNIKVVIISRERKKQTQQKGTYSSLQQQTLIPLPFVRSKESCADPTFTRNFTVTVAREAAGALPWPTGR